MTADPEVLARARAYASGDLSTLGLYEWLAGRGHPISDDLEAELWGLAVAVDEEKLTLDYAREWIRERIERQEESSPAVQTMATPKEMGALLISIPLSGGITVERVSRLLGFGSKGVSTTESWWRGVERRAPQAVPA